MSGGKVASYCLCLLAKYIRLSIKCLVWKAHNFMSVSEHPSLRLPSKRFSLIVQTSILEYLRLVYVTLFSSWQWGISESSWQSVFETEETYEHTSLILFSIKNASHLWSLRTALWHLIAPYSWQKRENNSIVQILCTCKRPKEPSRGKIH